MSKKYTCIICDRIFYKDQGVTLIIAGNTLTFHSKACALKFLRMLLDNIESNHLKLSLNKTLNQINEYKKALKEKREKRI